MSFRTAILLLMLTALLAASAIPARAADSMAVSHEIDMEAGLAGGATSTQDNLRIGSVKELNSAVRYVISPQVTNDLLLRFGAEWKRFSFSTPPAGALPDALQQVNAVVGFDYQLNDRWLLRTEVMPGLYSDFRQVDWRSFDAPVNLGFVLLQDADLQWFFGLRFDLRSQYPVLPAAGLRWQYADNWIMNFMLPNPRLEYKINDKLLAYAGAGLKAGTYVVGEHFGNDHGEPKLNNATVDFFEVRVGPGLSWEVTPRVTLDAEGGAMVYRVWDFFDEDVKLKSHVAPYVQIACRARF